MLCCISQLFNQQIRCKESHSSFSIWIHQLTHLEDQDAWQSTSTASYFGAMNLYLGAQTQQRFSGEWMRHIMLRVTMQTFSVLYSHFWNFCAGSVPQSFSLIMVVVYVAKTLETKLYTRTNTCMHACPHPRAYTHTDTQTYIHSQNTHTLHVINNIHLRVVLEAFDRTNESYCVALWDNLQCLIKGPLFTPSTRTNSYWHILHGNIDIK